MEHLIHTLHDYTYFRSQAETAYNLLSDPIIAKAELAPEIWEDLVEDSNFYMNQARQARLEALEILEDLLA